MVNVLFDKLVFTIGNLAIGLSIFFSLCFISGQKIKIVSLSNVINNNKD